MRLQGRPVDAANRLSKAETASSLKSVLSVGRKFTAMIVSVDGNQVSLELNGKIIRARNASSEHLFSGTNAQFEVLKSGSDSIEIRPVALSGLSSAENDSAFVKATLNRLGIPFSADNAELLSQMVKTGAPLSSGSFQELKHEVMSVQKVIDAIFAPPSSELQAGAPVLQDASPGKQGVPLELLFSSFADLLTEKEDLTRLGDFVQAQPGFDDAEALVNAGKSEEAPSTKPAELTKELPAAEDGRGAGAPEEGTELPARKDAELLKGFLLALKTMGGDREGLTQSLLFLNKLGIKPGIFSLSTLNASLNGKLGVSAALAELLQAAGGEGASKKDSLTSVLKHALKNSLSLSELAESLDADGLEERIKTFQVLKEELASARPEQRPGGSMEQLGLLKEHASLIKDLQPAWQSFVLPILHKNGFDDIELYVKKDGQNGIRQRKTDDRVIYLSLKTENIARVKVRIDYSKTDLKLMLLLENHELSEYAEGLISPLQERLSRMLKKTVRISVNSDPEKLNLAKLDLIASFKPSSKIDVRI